MEFKYCTLDVEDRVATLRLNHPEVMNAISPDMLTGLHDALTEIEKAGRDIRCVVLTGSGRAFSSGANLQGRRDQKPGDEKKALPGHLNSVSVLEWGYHPTIRRLRELRCPLITSVNGVAAGAGMSLALTGDLILAARSAYFLQAFRRIGLVPDAGSTWMLPRYIGRPRAMELSLLGERLPAEKALEWGLINRVYDDADLAAETRKLAVALAESAPLAMEGIRDLYWASLDNTFVQQLDLEMRAQKGLGVSEDFKEGVLAFFEKRPAVFKGR